MTVRTNELTSVGARPEFFKFSGRVFNRLAFMAGAVLVFLLAVNCQPSLSAPINYGSFMGTDVTYVDVTEASATDPVPLFGPPTVNGNSIDFNPVGFAANASGAGDSDITDGQLTFMVTAKPEKRILNISLSEAGDTTLAGIVPLNSTGTVTAVTASGVLNISEVDFAGINVISVPFVMTFNPSGGSYFLGTDGAGGPFFHTQWAGGVTLNLVPILAANGHPIPPAGGATKITLNLDNTLVAVSENGTTALIAKKDFGGLSITVNKPGEPVIPEPTTTVLAGLGLLGLLVGRRGRNA